ncbi:hypothetical protein C7974DRAFT_409025 [Boeremia exigua]|uniref:uncharacterized protein n=1 Tax=Boeremia exigua TaxID=749465 RepID=UPI001E8D7FA4|nr:uncharacterized protein C7974DRAFT_409025 [Boeremia exigua]KAH6642470.1 hypothetical protein C7974DRAFT_409025 [Boeremia exigua]
MAVITSSERKTFQSRQSALQRQNIDAPGDSDTTVADIASLSDASNETAAVETSGSEAESRWQELKAAKGEDQEIARYKDLQTKSRTKSEAEHDEILHELRLKSMRQRKAIREQLTAVVHSAEAVESIESQITPSPRRDSIVFSDEENSSSFLTSTFGPRWSCIQDERNENPFTSTSKSTNLRRTDTEDFSHVIRRSPVSPNTQWRDKHRQRGRLNANQDRIDTEFILANEFIDDVNMMLDFIDGWPRHQFRDIAESFEHDPENRDRIVEFVDLGLENWGVRILNPLRTEPITSFRLTDVYTLDDLPKACREEGCDKECPRPMSVKQKIADLKKFREQSSVDKMTGPRSLAGSRFGVLPDTPDLSPPILDRLTKREAETGLPQFGDVMDLSAQKPPNSPRPRNRVLSDPAPTPPSSPRPKSRVLPTDRVASQQVCSIENRIEEIDASMAQIRGQLLGSPASNIPGREVVKGWLQKANNAADSPNGRHRESSGSLGGKLVHHEKIPAGPDSIRSEARFLPSGFDNQDADQDMTNKSRCKEAQEEYSAIRASSRGRTDSADGAPPCPEDSRRSPSVSDTSPSFEPVQKIKFRPQYDKYPDAY